MRRDVLIEAGFRCAIPRCGATEIDIHHIVEYAVVREHTFDNLIVLCPNCHRRVTKGEIDPKAVKQIKANLSVLSHRYSELERRYMEEAADGNLTAGTGLVMSGGIDLLMRGLLEDDMVTRKVLPGFAGPVVEFPELFAPFVGYNLTTKGEEFIKHWLTAEPLD